MKKNLLFIALIIFLLNSCSIEKRVYRPGYYVQWNGNFKEMIGQNQKDKKERILPLERKPFALELTAAVPNSKEKQLICLALPNEKSAIDTNNTQTSKPSISTQIAASDLKSEASREKTSKLQTGNKKKESADNLIYLTTAFMALATLGFFRTNRKRVLKLTRWAKSNSKKTIGLIALLQLPLTALAFYTGHNLRELGYEVSNTLTYVFGAITTLGYLYVPFFAKHNEIAIPKIVSRMRMGYLGITLSSLMVMTSFGNRFVDKHPNSLVATAITRFDNAIFPPSNIAKAEYNAINPDSNQNNRKATVFMSLGLAIFLITLLVIVVCAGICIAIGGAIVMSEGDPLGILLLIAGIGITVLGVKGIQRVVDKYREN